MATQTEKQTEELRELHQSGDPRVLGWIKQAEQEAERIQKNDPSWAEMEKRMQYIQGNQLTGDRPSYLPSVVVNKTKKTARSRVSALTDVRPVFAFKTENKAFEQHMYLLNKMVIVWWVNTFADLELGDVIKYASVLGSGDCVVEYDPHLGHGDNRLIARDPRDTLPIRPSRDRSIQSWEGVILREVHSINALRASYPDKAHLINPTRGSSVLGNIYTKFRRIVTPFSPKNIFDQLGSDQATKTPATGAIPEVVLRRVFLRDRSVHMGTEPILMGDPNQNWSYWVKKGEPLYPRGRLIIATPNAVLFDGPSPYWHGMFPVTRLSLDTWPWLFFGLPVTGDLMPMQDAINKTFNDFLTNFSQHVSPGMIADKRSVPEPVMKRFDPRKPHWKLKINPTYGEGVKLAEPNSLPAWSLPFLNLMIQVYDDISGVANLQSLMQLRQLPSADTIQKYYEALTPELRMEARMIEVFLREAAEMLKVNIFQFKTKEQRMMLLGDPGITLQDFDYDPNNLVPSMGSSEEGYVPQLDKNRPRHERAHYFHKLFTFYVAPNSMLAMNATERKMVYLQLARMGYMDFWTLMETLEIQNVGEPPEIPNPFTGQPMKPNTITERLQAQQLIGIGMTTSPAGRKASGQAPPKLKTKGGPGGPRTTITES